MQHLNTIQDFIRWAMSEFNRGQVFFGHGAESPLDEAVQLILPSLDLPVELPERYFSCGLTESEKSLLQKRIKQRVQRRIPSAYLTNLAWFCGLEFYVDQRVLIPRSPIAELIKNGFSGILPKQPERILDLCTGSGCIAIACAAYFKTQVDAVDISQAALQVAEINIQRYGFEHLVFPIQSDLFTKLPEEKYDLIVSNPPYVRAEDLEEEPPEYQHEPRLALEAGVDGLKVIQRILEQAPQHLSEDGVLVCEVGHSAASLQALYPRLPFHWVELKNGGYGVFAIDREALLEYNDQSKAA